MMNKMKYKSIELYIHIPFCVQKCRYCDFLSFASTKERKERYVQALCQEIRETGHYIQEENSTVRSVFIGGGTPSILEVEQMKEIVSAVFRSFTVEEGAEISMEANPGTLNREKLQAYHNMGINRISIGLQSTEDDCLKKLGRIHTYQEFESNYQQAREAGFDNINIDLMSALPGQTLSSYKNTLETVLALRPEHISSYSLILEEGTPFYEDDTLIAQLPDEDTEREMYELTKSMLAEHGYKRYEISNYAREGRECLHNLGYWDDVPYLGMGLGASSYWKDGRFSNTSDIQAYIDQPFSSFEDREDYQIISREEQMEEFMYLGLRKMRGVSLSSFKEKFGIDMETVYGAVIDQFLQMNLLQRDGGRLSLTDQGINVSNRIFTEFLLED